MMETHKDNIPDKDNQETQQPEEAIWNAAVDGDWNAVKQWLEREPSLIGVVGCKWPYVNATLLHLAAKDSGVDVLKYLVSKGNDVNAKNVNGETPLHFAAGGNHDIRVLEYLVSSGADVNAEDHKRGVTPLHRAVENNSSIEIIERLVSLGADINATDTWRCGTPLHFAAAFNPDTEILECLISLGADVHGGNWLRYDWCEYGELPLDVADTREKCEILLEKMRDVEIKPLAKELKNTRDAIARIEKHVSDKVVSIDSETRHLLKRLRSKENVLEYDIKNYGYTDIGNPQHVWGIKEIAWEATIVKDWDTLKQWLDCDPSLIDITGKENYGGWTLPLLHCVASRTDNVEVLKYILSLGANVNIEDETSATPLWWAARLNSNVNVLKYLVFHGAEINVKDKYGWTPLHAAGRNNPNVEVLKYLISQGADINALDDEGQTPLDVAQTEEEKRILREAILKQEKPIWFAAANGDWESVKQQLENDPSQISVTNGSTLLHLAIRQDSDIEMLQYIISKSAEINAKDEDGWTPLLLAVWECSDIEILKCLVSAGADVNAKDYNGWTLLHEVSCGDSDIEILKYFIFHGAHVNIKDKENRTPLDIASTEEKKHLLHKRTESEKQIWDAAYNGDWGTAKQELENDPSLITSVSSIEFPCGRYGGCRFEASTLLHLAAMGTDVEILKYLVSKGIDVNMTNENWLTPLHVAALNRDYDEDVPNAEVLQYLVSQGADVTAIDGIGRTSLFYASKEQQKIILDPTLETKEPEKQIWAAAVYKYWDIVKQHLELDPLLIAVTGRASIDYFDNPYYYCDDGVSLVHLAVYRSEIDLLKYLIFHGANVNVKDAEGNTALHTAAEHSNSAEVIEYLISQGVDVNERNNNAPEVFLQRGFTPLHKAAWRNSNIEILKCLIAHGADTNAKDYNDKTPLGVADTEEKKCILRDAMLKPEEAIWKAATDGDWEAVKRWIEYDPSLSKTRDDASVEKEEFADITLLHLAVAVQDVDLLKYLISHGADVNAEDCDGITPLHCAIVETFNIEALKYLVSAGADIHAKNIHGETPLLLAVKWRSDIEVLEYLVSLGGDVFEKDGDGKTPLDIADTEEKKSILRKAMLEPKEAIWEAAESGDWETVKQYLKRDPSLINVASDAYIDYDDEEGELEEWFAELTLFHLAIINSDVATLKTLISFGADANAQVIMVDGENAPLFYGDGDLTALHLAVTNNATADVAKYLISQGADINVKDFNGKTPLELLIEKGRNIHANNND